MRCGGRLGVRPDNQNGQSGLGAELHLILRPGFQGMIAHHEQHHFCNLNANLQAERNGADCVKQRVSPRPVCATGHQHAVAAFTAKGEPRFNELRDHHHRSGALEQILGGTKLWVMLSFRQRGLGSSKQFRLVRVRARCTQTRYGQRSQQEYPSGQFFKTGSSR